jgi:hypothetical protein
VLHRTCGRDGAACRCTTRCCCCCGCCRWSSGTSSCHPTGVWVGGCVSLCAARVQHARGVPGVHVHAGALRSTHLVPLAAELWCARSPDTGMFMGTSCARGNDCCASAARPWFAMRDAHHTASAHTCVRRLAGTQSCPARARVPRAATQAWSGAPSGRQMTHRCVARAGAVTNRGLAACAVTLP